MQWLRVGLGPCKCAKEMERTEKYAINNRVVMCVLWKNGTPTDDDDCDECGVKTGSRLVCPSLS